MLLTDYIGKRILAVDDEIQNLMVIRHLLQRTGVILETAESGTEALKACARQQYDLILLDHMMPDPDGIKTLHLLRTDMQGQNRDTRVIVLTANAAKDAQERYLAEGFDGYLIKPFRKEQLEEILSRCMEPLDCAGAVLGAGNFRRVETVRSAGAAMDADAAGEAGMQEAGQQMRLLEQNGIRALEGLKYSDGDIAFYQKLCAVFVKELPLKRQKLERMIDSLSADEAELWKTFVSISHGLKGEARGIGADSLGELFYRMELLGRGREKNKIEEIYPAVISEWLRVTDIITTVF